MTTPLDDMCGRLVQSYREELKGNERAMFDLAVAIELKRRGLGDGDFHQLLRLRAEEHRHRSPFVWSLMKSLADVLTPGGNVVSIPSTRPGAKP